MLTPTARTGTETLNLALELVALCGAVPVLMDAAEHDRAVALVSHAPQLVASLMAARLEGAEPSTVRLAGQGVRDVVRTAASSPAMWMDILDANAGVVADVLDDLAADLTATVRALRDLSAAHQTGRTAGAARLADLLRRGNAGHGRIPGKHGAVATRYDSVAVLIGDQPGELARLLADVGTTGVNVEDVKIEHSPRDASGLVELSVAAGAEPSLAAALQARGWVCIRDSPLTARSGEAARSHLVAPKPCRTRPAPNRHKKTGRAGPRTARPHVICIFVPAGRERPAGTGARGWTRR